MSMMQLCEFPLYVIENEEGNVFKIDIVALPLFFRGHSTAIAVDA